MVDSLIGMGGNKSVGECLLKIDLNCFRRILALPVELLNNLPFILRGETLILSLRRELMKRHNGLEDLDARNTFINNIMYVVPFSLVHSFLIEMAIIIPFIVL